MLAWNSTNVTIFFIYVKSVFRTRLLYPPIRINYLFLYTFLYTCILSYILTNYFSNFLKIFIQLYILFISFIFFSYFIHHLLLMNNFNVFFARKMSCQPGTAPMLRFSSFYKRGGSDPPFYTPLQELIIYQLSTIIYTIIVDNCR